MPLHVVEQEKVLYEMIMGIEEEKLYEAYRKKETTINKDEVKQLDRPFTAVGKIVSIILIAISFFAIWHFTARAEEWYLLGGFMFAYLVLKELFALFYRPCKKELTKEYKVTAIITCFNENPTSVVSIFDNILEQDYPVHEVLFLDDGSEDPLAYRVAKSFAVAHKNNPNGTQFKIIRFEENRGKRELLVDGFNEASGDYLFMLDSDSEILPNALTELLRPFEKKKTTSVVGNIGILNKKDNFLTRLQSLTYFGSFQLGRAAQSVTGTVAICSGAFSLHKKDFILENIEEFKNNSLLGVRIGAGDDRSLTSLSKMAGGKTRYQSTAYCETEAPNKWRKFQSQRRRWMQSAYIGSLKSIKDVFPRKLWFLFWVFAEVYFWLIATIIFILAVIARGFYIDMTDIILYYVIIAYKQSIFYALYRPIRFIFAPIYFLAYGISLTITRIHAAITITNDSWGTRSNSAKGKIKEAVSTELELGEQGRAAA